MSREIKFRVRDAETGEFICYEEIKDGQWSSWWTEGELHLEQTRHSGIMRTQFNAIREQFTGFTDKNGNLIYEGDIVKDSYERIMAVVFREHKQTLEFEALTETNFKYAELHEWTENKDINSGDMTLMVKLIGNIRQHKHLLED